MARIVVVGAGVGGLAVAARLATGGHQVTVCEQAGQVGGKLASYERGGFRFDTGPSLLTLPQVLTDTFAATGAPLEQVLDLEPVEPIARYRFVDGAQLDTSADPVTMAAALESSLAPGSGLDWQRLLARAGRIWEAVEEPFLRQPVAAGRLARRLGNLATVAPGRTLRDLGIDYLRDPRLRMMLDRYATYAGSDPRQAPAALATVPFMEQAFGAWHVRGGLARIGTALADRAQQRGAVLRTGADVTAVESAGGRVAGVRLADGERLRADVVVANTDAGHLYRELVRDRRARRARRRLRRVTLSSSAFVLLLGVRGHTAGLAHHNVLFPADYDAEFDALFGPHPRPVREPTLYVVRAEEAGVAPPGHEAWFVLINAPRHGQVDWSDHQRVAAYRGHLLHLLAARGLDVHARLVLSEVRTPLDLARQTRAVGGAIYGTSSNGALAAFLRPANRSPVPGLFLVGGSAHPGGGLPLVLLSAAIVADMVGPA